jgi:hypothetical protein
MVPIENGLLMIPSSGGQTVINPFCMLGGVASSVCENNEYIM